MMKPVERPEIAKGVTHKVKTGCGNAYITINMIEKKPSECFIFMGRSGSCGQANFEGIGRLVSLALRSGVKIGEVIDQLEGIRCPQPTDVKSCADAVAKVLKMYVDDGGDENGRCREGERGDTERDNQVQTDAK